MHLIAFVTYLHAHPYTVVHHGTLCSLSNGGAMPV